MLNADILHRDFTPDALLVGSLSAGRGRPRRGAAGRRGWRSSAAAMPGSRQRSSSPSTASTRWCSKQAELGFGASTRNGGAVSGGVNIGKSFTGRAHDIDPERAGAHPFRRHRRLCAGRPADRRGSDRLLLGEARPVCRRLDANSTSRRNQRRARRCSTTAARSGAYMVPRERQREEIASDYYHGGMVVERSGKLHPALYYKGLLDACRRRDVAVCAKAAVGRIARVGNAWRVETSRGEVDGRRRRHRHQRLYRRSDPGAAAPHRADRQPHHRHRGIAARSRPLADPARAAPCPTRGACCAITACRPMAGAWSLAAAPALPRSARRSARRSFIAT